MRVELVSHMGGDLSVVNAARVSFGKGSQELGDAEIGLINFLMKNRHGTPFEHNAFTFAIECPIFVSREWFRHRIGSFNEFSTRYSKVTSPPYVPPVENFRTQTGKPGHYKFEDMEASLAAKAANLMADWQLETNARYEELLDMGVAKEVARNLLPLSTMTMFWWTVNARSMMNFLSLRTSPHALREIRECALEVESIFAEQMPHTYNAWHSNGRLTP